MAAPRVCAWIRVCYEPSEVVVVDPSFWLPSSLAAADTHWLNGVPL